MEQTDGVSIYGSCTALLTAADLHQDDPEQQNSRS
jgi:hypothetical protein